MYSSPVDASLWQSIAQTIATLMSTDPTMGLFVIVLSIVVFAALLLGVTWAMVRITRARKQPVGHIFHEEAFTRNVLEMIKKLTAFNNERDQLSRRHEQIKQHSIVRDQIIVAEGSIDQIRNILMLTASDKVTDHNPHMDEAVSENPNFMKIESTLERVLSETFTFFRRVAKENHIVEKSEEQFFEYVNMKVDRIYTLSLQSINVQGTDSKTVKTAKKIFDENWREVEATFRRLFTEMRYIASQYYEMIRKESEDYDERWSEFIASIPDQLLNGVKEDNG